MLLEVVTLSLISFGLFTAYLVVTPVSCTEGYRGPSLDRHLLLCVHKASHESLI